MLNHTGTSKHAAGEALLGRNGTFLASLAAVSLVTIVSRHHEYRSQNLVTFHHAEPIERQLPASGNHQVQGKQGTRVTVRNLFGNLPVRVKHRSLLSEHKTEQDRVWDLLKRDIVGLLLSWQGTAHVRVRDGDNRLLYSFNTSSSTVNVNAANEDSVKPRSKQLSAVLSILTQANYISVHEWARWVPASASTIALTIKGAISLNPAPSKTTQFLSFGIHPVSASAGHNELYDEINRLFALSSFGNLEDDADVDSNEMLRRSKDGRFKHDGYTNRQLKARKDVDRHPMFHLCITWKGENPLLSLDNHISDKGNLQTVLDVLGAMITQWLSVHHFRPKQKRRRPATATIALSTTTGNEVRTRGMQPSRTSSRAAVSSSSGAVTGKHPRLTSADTQSRNIEHGAFAEWSRIKSGKSSFFNNLPTLTKTRPQSDSVLPTRTRSPPRSGSTLEGFAPFNVVPLTQGALSAQPTEDSNVTCASQDVDAHIQADMQDDTILWTNPTTRDVHVLNARTGCVVPKEREYQVCDSQNSARIHQGTTRRSVRYPTRTATITAGSTPWLDDMLQTWDNPIFKTSELRIKRTEPHDHDNEYTDHTLGKHNSSRIDVERAFNQRSVETGLSQLSKDSLRCAEIIAQVDRKFILVKAPYHPRLESLRTATTSLLVLVDQHAADERIRVESLLQELCTPIISSIYQSNLGHSAQVASILLENPIQYTISPAEQALFTTHAAHFAAWGILFNLSSAANLTIRPTPSTNHQPLLSVTFLPPSIAERCKSNPQLLISFLRTTVWKYAEDPPRPPASASAAPSDWVRRLASCPPGLVDMINSRACRSAVMFNDELSMEDCKEMLERLALCLFPFMCAHGRPSMVPLVKLGEAGVLGDHSDEEVGGHGEGEEGNGGFVRKWKTWKESRQDG